MAIVKINSVDEFNQAKNEGKVLVDFYADWCGPCKMMEPMIEELVNENSDLTVLKVNVDNLPDLAAEFAIMSIPTLVLFKDGEATSKLIGLQSKQKISQFIQ
ncbi:Thioredoxin [Mesoplasma sp. JKS002658]|uniref:thioredoxin n=1 Tax=Mesoplasma whartonense TaxID=2878854 RepID=UPI002022A87A|nr:MULTISPECIES: thioredoxin [unclassified Mesoplasma]MCL8211587.1 Thioredoxin [Mesoplasma sp. JKS002664]MCL8212047.1 Thioredoxin [Mesoplasma sp. JKS002662]MCL8213077.1 Thioredoxin [Mesoplasma sp. JKS002661]MCL8213716.1 Thioredoxin [Mesoplasma sp. JKS002660]MCL8213848.1 Thioredoxin [Mesoplasma sp. JKS002658]